MMSEHSSRRSSAHVTDLLPAYLGGTLSPIEVERVRAHLSTCAECRAELATWAAIRDVAQAASAPERVPSLSVLERAWGEIEAQASAPANSPRIVTAAGLWTSAALGRVRSLPRSAAYLRHAAYQVWLVLLRQPALLQDTWLLPLLALFLCDSIVPLAALRLTGSMSAAAATLTVVVSLAAAVGIVFVANLTSDVGSEIALATPTSVRTILFCRFLLVVGVSSMLAGGASIAIAALSGQGFWGIIQLWLGPMLLASSLTLALMLVVGSWLAVLPTCLIEVWQLLRVSADGQVVPLQHPHLWHTDPIIVLLALLCWAFVFLYAPRRAPFARNGDTAW